MKIGYFGSSFDPPTNAHLYIANDIAERFGLDWVILRPCSNKRPDKNMKTSDEHRWTIFQLAVSSYSKFIPDDYEMKKMHPKSLLILQ
ncbi:nicotinate-nicotinamide nucleotide adenylyltransferase [Paenibacillus thiaminolyticus]|uniref:nicotinate-nicotinamide nucleotide adenylyltransferase n=1 Tax=Paenibacillus thiaminolyticus TaxID=49283 RepID=UPI003B982AC2